MSTRANVKIFDRHNALYFYQHSDGYPDGLGAWLKRCLSLDKVKQHINDIEYLAGVLIMEYNEDYFKKNLSFPDLVPAVGIHGDESYFYEVNSETLELKIYNRSRVEIEAGE